MRLSQLMDEADHKRCSKGNRNALLAETLHRLRDLVKEIEEDDWMYSSSTTKSDANNFYNAVTDVSRRHG